MLIRVLSILIAEVRVFFFLIYIFECEPYLDLMEETRRKSGFDSKYCLLFDCSCVCICEIKVLLLTFGAFVAADGTVLWWL